MADEYRIGLNGRWRLEDLYVFPHAFSQIYAFTYCLDSDLDPRDSDRIEFALQNYPWAGGYSYVNIYSVLQSQVPIGDRPIIASMHYASPGWLDLFLNPDVAVQVAKSVATFLGSILLAMETYKRANKMLSDINLQRKRHELAKARLTTAQAREILKISEVVAKFVGFENLQQLHEKTGSPEISLRLLMAHYRRLETLAEFVKSGKAILPQNSKEDD